MIELQRQGLTRSRASSGSGGPRHHVDGPEDCEERDEEEEGGGWESGDEGQWSSEGGDRGREGDGEGEEEGEEEGERDEQKTP